MKFFAWITGLWTTAFMLPFLILKEEWAFIWYPVHKLPALLAENILKLNGSYTLVFVMTVTQGIFIGLIFYSLKPIATKILNKKV